MHLKTVSFALFFRPGTKEAVKSAFVGIAVNINGTDLSEVTQEELVAQCNKV